jgi:hypothetical protein
VCGSVVLELPGVVVVVDVAAVAAVAEVAEDGAVVAADCDPRDWLVAAAVSVV